MNVLNKSTSQFRPFVSSKTKSGHSTRVHTTRVYARGSNDGERRMDERFTNEVYLKMRSEAETPFRSVRFLLFGGGAASGFIGLVTSIPQVIAAAANAPGAVISINEALTNIAIDFAAFAGLGYLLKRELDSREKQIARLEREETLAALPLEILGGKRLRLSDLRGTVRVVIVAGTGPQVEASLAKAEPLRAELQRRGVSVIPLPILDSDPAAALDRIKATYYSQLSGASEAAPAGEGAAAEEAAKAAALARRWLVVPLRTKEWGTWVTKQMGLANVTQDKATQGGGVYLSLRLDGRIRGSGVGSPPWAILAAQLPPTDGIFGPGFLDGMDGRISSFD